MGIACQPTKEWRHHSAPAAACSGSLVQLPETRCTKGAPDGQLRVKGAASTNKQQQSVDTHPLLYSGANSLLSGAMPEQHRRLPTVASPPCCRPVCIQLVSKAKAGSDLVTALD